MRKPVLALAAVPIALPLMVVTMFVGIGGVDPPPAQAGGTTCTIAPTASPATPAPAGTPTSLTGSQVEMARVVVAGAKTLALPEGEGRRASAIGVMTAMQESSLTNLPDGDRDSIGLFQQRPSQGWGTPDQLHDPGYQTARFYAALTAVPGWQAMPLWRAAQAVQASVDGTLYAKWQDLGAAVTDALWAGTAGTVSCAPVSGGPITGPGGTFPAEACSVVPDPTTGRGCLTPRTLNLALQLKAQGWSLTCWDAHAWNPTSDHPLGRACDAFPGPGGVLPTPQQKARGDALVATLQATAAQTGVKYLIWYGQIWTVARAGDGWRPYGGGGVYDPASITGGHYDHVHISVY